MATPKKPDKETKRKPVHLPQDEWTKADIYALQALATGTASEDQQKRALKYIVENVCQTYQPSYRPEGDRETAFAEGRRAVGLRLIALIQGINPSAKEFEKID